MAAFALIISTYSMSELAWPQKQQGKERYDKRYYWRRGKSHQLHPGFGKVSCINAEVVTLSGCLLRLKDSQAIQWEMYQQIMEINQFFDSQTVCN